MEEGLPEFLLLVPGLSRALAHRLARRFETRVALGAATIEDLLLVEGMSPDLARRVLDAVAFDGPTKKDAGLYICPNCGSFVSVATDRCPHCGTVFESDEAPESRPEIAPPEEKPAGDGAAKKPAVPEPQPIPDDVRDALQGLGVDLEKAKDLKAKSRWDAGTGEEAPGLFLCGNCGGFINADSSSCPTCGADVEAEEAAPEAERRALAQPADVPRVCLSCGAFNPPGTSDCGTCGTSLSESLETLPTKDEAVVPKGFLEPARRRREVPAPAPVQKPAEPGAIPSGFLQPRRPEPPAAPRPPEEVIPASFLAPRRPEVGKAPEPSPAPRVPAPRTPAELPALAAKPEVPEPLPPKKEEVLERLPEEVPAEEAPEGTPEPEVPAPAEAAPLPIPPARPRRERGATKDFARRWKRVTEAPEADPRAALEKELDHWDELIRTDPSLERAWHRRAQLLAELGRREEAIEAYDRLTQLDPEREEEYRLEALDLVRPTAVIEPLDVTAPADVSPVAPAWTPEQRPDTAALERALEMYDRLVMVDAELTVAWETRAEILRRLGRDEEAEASLAQAHDLERRQQRVTAEGLVGLQTRSLLRAAVQTGRINGLVNGSAGRTNGLVNGLGHTNGLSRVFATAEPEVEGRINGLNALPVLRGATDGLVNGDGFVNGRYARGMPRLASPSAWVRPTVGVAIAVVVLVLLPLLGSYALQQSAPPGIVIDGLIADWNGVPSYVDADDTATAATDLRGYRVHRLAERLSAYVETRAPLFSSGLDAVDSVYLFVDADGSEGTGFEVQGLGAEFVLQVWGWNGIPQGNGLYAWMGGSPDDFGGFRWVDGVAAERAGSLLELQAFLPDLGDFRTTLVLTDNAGSIDFAERSVAPDAPSMVLSMAWTAPPVISVNGPVANLDVDASGASRLTRVLFAAQGNASAVTYTLFADDGDGVYSPGDLPVASAAPLAGSVTFALDEGVEGRRRFIVTATLGGDPATASLGLRLLGASTDASLRVSPGALGASYHLAAPGVTADGAFADWSGVPISDDGDDDVSVRGRPFLDENIDLRRFALHSGPNVGLLFEVDGRVLGGIDVPYTHAKPLPATFEDADRDTVPDSVEDALGTGLSFDFNNDNVSDDLSIADVDGDGTVDYDLGGTDSWLNTTIPAWFGVPWAGKNVTLFLGPYDPLRYDGSDTALAYIDADNSTATGLYYTFQGVDLGVDYVVEVRGRDQRVTTAGLYAFVPLATNPFERVADVATGLDAQRLEVSFPSALANVTAQRRVVFYVRNSEQSFDNAYVSTTRGAGATPRPSNPAGTDVVINEISARSNPEWFEIANPTNAARNLNGCVLERRQGGNWVNVYTFTQTVGAFGSGTEYLAVNLAGNTLPNGGATLRLRCGANEIDRTSYPAHSAAQSWARLKDPLTGRPMDSDVDAADFYIDATPTRAGPNTRHRPTMTLAKTANTATSGPGGTITYTVYYNNTNTGRANTVWINDTLPAAVSYVSSSVPYDSFSGSVYRWRFTNVNPNTQNSFTVTVRVGPASLGASLVNQAQLQYSDQLNRMLGGTLSAWANVTVVRPVITVVKVSDVAQQVPGGFVTYTIFYNNTGNRPANTVWVNDTLPPQVTFFSSSVPPSSSSGQTYRWQFANVAPGAQSFTITVQVNPNATLGDQVNWAFLNYTSQFDFVLESSQESALVYVPEYDLPVAVGMVGLLLFGIQWRRSRRGRPSEPRAEIGG